MTEIFRSDSQQIRRWRSQAAEAAVELKKCKLDKPVYKIAFAFDDGLVKLGLTKQFIMKTSTDDLSEFIFNKVLAAAQTHETKGSA